MTVKVTPPAQVVPDPDVTMLNALLVDRGKIRRIFLPEDEDDGAHTIYGLIGNYFTSAFTVEVEGSGRFIHGLCDEDFLLHPDDAKWNVAPEPGVLRKDVMAVGGPLVIMATDRRGATVSMTEGDMKAFWTSDYHRVAVGMQDETGRVIPVATVPILYFNRARPSHEEALDDLPL